MADAPSPTIADVARKAGVSKGLVSFALNDRPGVSSDTRRRILQAADELGWTPSLAARALSTGRSFACGLVIGRSTDVIAADPSFHTFIAGVEGEFSVSGQVLVLAVATTGPQEHATYRGLASDKRVDGVILTDLRSGDERIALLRELGLPAVTLGEPDIESPYSSVSIDDGSGIRAAVDHLVELGHRRLAHVAGPERMLQARHRRSAFHDATRAAGVDGVSIETDIGAAAGAAATEALLSSADPPTGIVYSNDHMAIAGLGVAQRRGRSVPRDLSITGFDDTEIGRYIHPALTSVATDARAWGTVTARALLDAIAGKQPVHVRLPAPTLATRDSTGPAPNDQRGDRRR